MNNKEIKKIQFGKYSKRYFSEIRNKVKSFEDENSLEKKISLKKKKKCKFNKGIHIFEKHEYNFIKRIYCKEICINCGKQKYS